MSNADIDAVINQDNHLYYHTYKLKYSLKVSRHITEDSPYDLWVYPAYTKCHMIFRPHREFKTCIFLADLIHYRS